MQRDEFLRAVGDGRFFSAKFVKRTNGEIRKINARVGVKNHLKGGEKNFKDEDYDLVTVYDLMNGGYRSIPMDSLVELKAHGKLIYRHPDADEVEKLARKTVSTTRCGR